jgi:hypothetical protein
MGDAAGGNCHAAWTDPVVGAVDVHEDLALQYVERLVLLGVDVQWRGLSLRDSPEDPAERLKIVAEDHTQRILANEAQMRSVLRLSLEGVRPPELPMHQRLRTAWIEDALAPLRGQMAEDELPRLIRGIGATLGIEAFVWLTDIAGVSREEAASIIRSNALGLLRSAMSDGAVIDA